MVIIHVHVIYAFTPVCLLSKNIQNRIIIYLPNCKSCTLGAVKVTWVSTSCNYMCVCTLIHTNTRVCIVRVHDFVWPSLASSIYHTWLCHHCILLACDHTLVQYTALSLHAKCCFSITQSVCVHVCNVTVGVSHICLLSILLTTDLQGIIVV